MRALQYYIRANIPHNNQKCGHSLRPQFYASAAKRAKALCSLVARPSGCPSIHPIMYAATFLYFANMLKQIEFIIYTNIQPLPQKFFTKGQGHTRSKVKVKDSKKCFVNAITWKIIIASLQFFM